MPVLRIRPAAALPFTVIALLGAGCGAGSGIEGKYYNSRSGEFALELKGGKVIEAQGLEGQELSYTVRGDSLIIHDPQGGLAAGFTLGIEKDGSLSAGPLGSLTKNRK